MDKSDIENGLNERGLRYLPYAIVGVLAVYMGWIRMFSYSSVVTEDGVLFSANDPWYHLRVVEYLVENYPTIWRFDPWTQFPYGSAQSTGYGLLFDQITATAALIVGLGNPSSEQIALVVAFAPVAFGVASVVPVYFIARKITDRWFAVISTLVMALTTGQFLNRTTFGNAQHQSAEAFFLALAVLGFIVAVERAYKEKPTVAHLRDGDWEGVRKPMMGAILGGIAFAAYILTWSPAIYLVVPLGIFVIVQMVRDHVNGDSTEYLALTMSALFLVTALLVFTYGILQGPRLFFRFNGTKLGLLQVIATAGAGVGILFLHGVREYMHREEYDTNLYPVAVGGIVLVGVVFLWLTGLISLFENLVGRMYSFGYLTDEGVLTIAEVQPAGPGDAFRDFGALAVLGFVGILLLLYRVVRNDRPIELIVLLWSLNMYSAYFTQQRFGYYLTLGVAVTVTYAVYEVFRVANFDTSIEDWREIKGYQVIAAVLILFLFVPVLIVPVGGAGPAWMTAGLGAGGNTPWQVESMGWMQNNTPEVPMEFNEPHPVPEGEDFDYPEGAYGVLSWWDYGHWIQMTGERIPNANPFQEGNQMGSDYFTSQSEERSHLILEAIPAMGPDPNTDSLSEDELREIANERTEQQRNENTRYVVIDDQMAAGKFGAIGTWTGFGQYFEQQEFTIPSQDGNGTPVQGFGLSEKYDNTTLARLYQDDADSMEGYRLVHETETYSLIGSVLNVRTGRSQRLNRVVTRADYDDDSLGFSIQRANQFPDEQMIQLGQGGEQYLYDIRGLASVKTFERVEGATITGEANVTEPTNVTAFLELQTTNTNRTFAYTARTETDDNGNFNMTVPYPTVNDVPVEEGGTDASVESLGSYEILTGNVGIASILGQTQIIGVPRERGTVDIAESDVYEGNELNVEVSEVETQQSGNESGDTISIEQPSGDGESTDDSTGTEGEGSGEGTQEGTSDGGTEE